MMMSEKWEMTQSGFPVLSPQRADFFLKKDTELRNYTQKPSSKAVCHFYIDDHKFSAVMKLRKSLEKVRRYYAVLSPDFSIFPEMPLPLVKMQIFKSRFVSRYWQECGLAVIPVPNWTDSRSFGFCFDGIPAGQVISAEVPSGADHNFVTGYNEMCTRLSPRQIFLYGSSLPEGCRHMDIPVIHRKRDGRPR